MNLIWLYFFLTMTIFNIKVLGVIFWETFKKYIQIQWYLLVQFMPVALKTTQLLWWYLSNKSNFQKEVVLNRNKLTTLQIFFQYLIKIIFLMIIGSEFKLFSLKDHRPRPQFSRWNSGINRLKDEKDTMLITWYQVWVTLGVSST